MVLPVTAERVGLLIHLLGAFAFVGGITTAGIAFEVARGRRSALEVAAVLRVSRIGALVGMAGGILLLLGGLWLAGDLDLYRTRWLQLSILAFVLSLLFGAAGGRRPRQAREMAERIAAGDEGGAPERMRALLNDRAALFTNYLSVLLALLVLVLMIWQPAL